MFIFDRRAILIANLGMKIISLFKCINVMLDTVKEVSALCGINYKVTLTIYIWSVMFKRSRNIC